MQIKRGFFCLAAIASLASLTGLAHAGDTLFTEWTMTVTETSRSYPYGTQYVGYNMWSTGPSSLFTIGGGGYGDWSVQGTGNVTATAQGYSTSSAYYGEVITTTVTMTRTIASNNAGPQSLHIDSNSFVNLTIAYLASTEWNGSAGWDIYYNGSSRMSHVKSKTYIPGVSWVIGDSGTGEGHVYLAPTSSSGTAGQIGETKVFTGVRFTNDTYLLAGRCNPSTPLTSSGGVQSQFIMRMSQHAPHAYTSTEL